MGRHRPDVWLIGVDANAGREVVRFDLLELRFGARTLVDGPRAAGVESATGGRVDF